MKLADGSQNLLEWQVGIPGKDNVRPLKRNQNTRSTSVLQTSWEGGVFKLVMSFPEGALATW